jgi:hypothetical protein
MLQKKRKNPPKNRTKNTKDHTKKQKFTKKYKKQQVNLTTKQFRNAFSPPKRRYPNQTSCISYIFLMDPYETSQPTTSGSSQSKQIPPRSYLPKAVKKRILDR